METIRYFTSVSYFFVSIVNWKPKKYNLKFQNFKRIQHNMYKITEITIYNRILLAQKMKILFQKSLNRDMRVSSFWLLMCLVMWFKQEFNRINPFEAPKDNNLPKKNQQKVNQINLVNIPVRQIILWGIKRLRKILLCIFEISKGIRAMKTLKMK